MHVASDDLKTCHGTDHETRPHLQMLPESLTVDEYRLCLSVVCTCWGNISEKEQGLNIQQMLGELLFDLMSVNFDLDALPVMLHF